MGDRRKSSEKGNGNKENQVSDNKATLETIQSSVTEVNRKLDSLRTTQNKTNTKVQNISTDIERLSTKYTTLQEENTQLKAEVNMLKAVVSKQASDFEKLRHDLIDQQARQMRGNILFHQIPESKNEDCKKKVKDMLSKHGYTEDIEIDLIHRLGRFDNNAATPRPIVAKLTTCSQVNALLKFGQTQKDKMKVTPQFPTELRAKRQQLGEIAENARSKGEDVKTKIVSDTLYINGNRYVEDLPRPSARDILFMSDTEKKDAATTKFEEARKQISGSTFIVRATRVHSINDCRAAYKSLLWNPDNMVATHNTAAYRLFSPQGAVTTTGYNDDGEHGMGKVVRDSLHRLDAKDVIVFVTRYYGGQNIGQKRFDTVKDLVNIVMGKLKEKN